MTVNLSVLLLVAYFPIVCVAAWYDHRSREIPRWLIVPPFYAALVYFMWRLWNGLPSYGITSNNGVWEIATASGHVSGHSVAVGVTILMMIVLYGAAVLRFRGSHLIGGADARVLITIGALIPAVSVGGMVCIPTLPLLMALSLLLTRLFPLADKSIREDWKERGIPGLIPVCIACLLLTIALW